MVLFLAASACRVEILSAPKRPARDGYRAVFVQSDGSRVPLAVRRARRRMENRNIVRILDLPEKKTTLLRPDREAYFKSPTQPGAELAPVSELTPPSAPKDRFPRPT